jgi:hypothetical protein
MATELHRFEVRLIAPTDTVGLVPAQVRVRADAAASAFGNAVRSAGRADILIRGRSSTGVLVETTDAGHDFLSTMPQVVTITSPV